MKGRKLLVAAALLLAFLLAAVLVYRRSQAGQVESLHAYFLSVTNFPTGGQAEAVIVVTNQTRSTMVFRICSPIIKSNGFWTACQPLQGILSKIGPGQSQTTTAMVASSPIETKVPVLWGFDYKIPHSRWEEMLEDAVVFFDRRNPGGRGALYTNMVVLPKHLQSTPVAAPASLSK